MEEENALSVADIFRIIFSQKWLALIIAAVFTVLGVVGITCIYNPRVSVYSVKFSLNLPGNSDGTYFVYPDGYILYYNSLVSQEKLNEVKKSNNDFSDIDIGGMTDGGNIELTSELKTEEGTNASERQFGITVKKSCFKSDDEAHDFLKAVTEVPVNYFADMPVDVYLHLQYNRDTVNYGTAVNNIKSQIEYLKSEYRALANNYGYSFIVELGTDRKQNRSLQSYLIDIDNYLDTGVIDGITADIEENGYVRNEAAKAKYRIDLTELESEHAKAVTTLENVMKVTVTDNTQVIKAQSDLVYDLEKKIAVLEKYINGAPSADIEKRIDDLYKEVEGFTDTYKTVQDAVYKKLSFVTYEDANIVSSVGGMGMIATIIISLAVGTVVAMIVAYFVGYVKYRKKSRADGAPSAVPYGADSSENQTEQDKT